jgi:hypothetical protein
VLKSSYAPQARESSIYFGPVWGLVLLCCMILLAGFAQPLVLLVISACVDSTMMFGYALLIVLNRRVLPEPIRITGAVKFLTPPTSETDHLG